VTAIEPTRREKLANWSRRRPRFAAALGTLAAVLALGLVATAVQASIENAKVAVGYGYIDDFDARIAEIEREMEDLRRRREGLEPGPERTAVDNRLAALQAEFEVAQEDRRAIGLAITGFTILSPEKRARAIVRDAIWDDIDEHLSNGDLYRARAHLDSALGYHREGNVFGFSDEEHVRLERMLTDVDEKIAARETRLGAPGEPP
jgi:hypothetical protein